MFTAKTKQTAAWLPIGPTPWLSGLVFLLTAAEVIPSFGNGSVRPDVPALFYSFIICGIFCFWLATIWLTYAASKRLNRFLSRSVSRSFAFVTVSLIAWTALASYAMAWAVRFYTGVFPGFESLQMLRGENGAAFIVSFLQDTAADKLHMALLLVGASVIAVPLLLYQTLKSKYTDRGAFLARRVAVYGGLCSLGVAVCCLGYIVSGPNFDNRRAQVRYIQTSVSPPITYIANIVQAVVSGEAIAAKMSADARLPLTVQPTAAPSWQGQKPPNVIYLVLESARADLIFQTVDGVEVTPNLNFLARNGYYFPTAHAQASHTDYCVPSYLSSLYPLRQQDHHYYDRNSPWPKVLIYDYLADLGYTAGIITSDNTAWGRQRNFMRSEKLDVYFDSENLPTTYTQVDTNRGYVSTDKVVPENGAATSPDRKTLDIAFAWMTRQVAAGKPFFLHSMLQDAHFPYTQGEAYPKIAHPSDTSTFQYKFFKCPPDKVPILKNAYLNCAHQVDAEIGRLISFLKENGQFENTLFVICGDHGESFMENGLMAHAGPSTETVLRVPMILFDPRQPGKRVEYPAEQIDLAPTLCGLLGVAPHPGFQGIDLLSEKRLPVEERYTFASSQVPGFWKGDCITKAGRWKFWNDITNGRQELYDLAEDPLEENNILQQKPELARELAAKLATWRQNQLAYYKFPIFYGNYHPPRNIAHVSSSSP